MLFACVMRYQKANRTFWRGVLYGTAMPLPWLAAWACFGAGHVTSRAIVNNIPDSWERTGAFFAGCYQLFMRWSVFLNDRFELIGGPWGAPVRVRDEVNEC